MFGDIGATAPIMAVAITFLIPGGMSIADKPPEKKKSITVAELREMKVVGSLDHSFGEIVTIEGVAAGEDYRRSKGDLGHTLLRIQSVNGKKLTEEWVFHFSPFSDDVKKPKVGSRFKYVGYETGGFTGLPTKAFEIIGLIDLPGYAFTTTFVILRDELKRK